ncbi:hypothetical protein EMIHUDRAFT_432758 [Emiliania huxleyi CCMP1516]|uniref:Uncharacterized protein n=2 Tax=Emiliania huxleyi TaxID=2903 RepID=A0A0D3IUK2_EMIH1|nr:hypothetical protein EMIHUDRAFT_432758 [Emiliania huxleyi CCMP1516]EOD14937.1 hypothetical protein EMIHUDRAFT_432758 [Emiliania huxleyi CCMP1516]|eukprot:XP_005767366.1 hypothetical protein EMIHUDRAFT_432758 [Emiliania huxleyi CCMP1516]
MPWSRTPARGNLRTPCMHRARHTHLATAGTRRLLRPSYADACSVWAVQTWPARASRALGDSRGTSRARAAAPS